MQEGLAASTRRSYCTGVRRYLAFCAAGRRTPFPASENQLMDFAAFVAQSAGYGTIKVYLAGIRLEHIQRGLQNPFSSCPRLQLVLRGIRRKLARTPRPRLRNALKLVFDVICFPCTIYVTVLLPKNGIEMQKASQPSISIVIYVFLEFIFLLSCSFSELRRLLGYYESAEYTTLSGSPPPLYTIITYLFDLRRSALE